MKRDSNWNLDMAFFAIQPPIELRQVIDESLTDLKRQFQGVDWVNPHDFHITLKFMAGLTKEELIPLLNTVGNCVSKHSGFMLSLANLGLFYRRDVPAVIWIGTTEDALNRLASGIDKLLFEEHGIPKSAMPFRPHLTIGRVTQTQIFDDKRFHSLDFKQKQLEWFVSEVVLMKRKSQSDQKENEPIYEPLGHIALRNENWTCSKMS